MSEGKLTIPKIQKMKVHGDRIVAVTCYDYTFARLVDKTADIVLVGDSLGMVIQGEKSTLPVTLQQMAYHTACVARGTTHPLLVTDMPFMSYQSSHRDALQGAGRLMKAGAESVKIEGGVEVAELTYRMNRLGIPVMAHIGLQPQSINKYGGYKVRGKTIEEERSLLEDARAIEEAGAWSVVLEGIPQEVAEKITDRLKIPTIGIGSGPDCDGQILVLYDLLGMNPEFKPRFVKHFAELGPLISEALSKYRQEVKEKTFPTEEHSFHRNLIDVTDRLRRRDARSVARRA